MPCNAPAASRGFPDRLRPAPLTAAAPGLPAPPRGRAVPADPLCVVVDRVVVAPLRRREPLPLSVLRLAWASTGGSADVAGSGFGTGVGGRSEGAAVHRCAARPARPVAAAVEVTLPSAAQAVRSLATVERATPAAVDSSPGVDPGWERNAAHTLSWAVALTRPVAVAGGSEVAGVAVDWRVSAVRALRRRRRGRMVGADSGRPSGAGLGGRAAEFWSALVGSLSVVDVSASPTAAGVSASVFVASAPVFVSGGASATAAAAGAGSVVSSASAALQVPGAGLVVTGGLVGHDGLPGRVGWWVMPPGAVAGGARCRVFRPQHMYGRLVAVVKSSRAGQSHVPAAQKARSMGLSGR